MRRREGAGHRGGPPFVASPPFVVVLRSWHPLPPSRPRSVHRLLPSPRIGGVLPKRLASDSRQGQAGKVLGKRPVRPFSVVFIDPPYEMRVLGNTLTALLKNGWTTPGAVINAEVEARTPFDPATAHTLLTPLADRSYGQTRVLLWTHE